MACHNENGKQLTDEGQNRVRTIACPHASSKRLHRSRATIELDLTLLISDQPAVGVEGAEVLMSPFLAIFLEIARTLASGTLVNGHGGGLVARAPGLFV